MSISSRAVALIIAKPLDPEKARRYTHMRFGSRWNPSIRGVFGIKRDAEAYFRPVPKGMDRWLDEHMGVFTIIMSAAASYGLLTLIRSFL